MKQPRRTVLLILSLAFAMRVILAVIWQQTANADGQLFRLGDSDSYWVLAQQIVHGRPYEYGSENARIFRAPVYPLVLATVAWIPDDKWAVFMARLLGAALGTVAVALLMRLAHNVSGCKSASATGFLAAIYPPACGMSIVVLSEAVFVPLMVAYLLAWQNAWLSKERRVVQWLSLAAGGLAGLAILARPSWLLFPPFLFLGGFVLSRDQRAKHSRIFGFTLLGIVLVMSPWWIRNASITGQFVLTTLQVGPSLYDGLHSGATGGSDEGMAFSQRFVEEQRAADAQSTQPLPSTFEYRVNQRAQRAAVQWARENPIEVIKLAMAKFSRTWSIWPDGGELGSLAIRATMTISCFGILFLASIATGMYWQQWSWRIGLCWMPAIYFTLLHMVFVGSTRYREPAVFVLCALAGGTIVQLLAVVRNRRDTSPTRGQGSASSASKPK